MTLRSYESQEITIDLRLAERLTNYLEKKETELCSIILKYPFSDNFPFLAPAESTSLLLPEVVQIFGKKIDKNLQSQQESLPRDEWKAAATAIQESLWGYIEVLKESTTELFQQLDHIGCEHWDMALYEAMEDIKEMLMHRMHDLLLAVKQLDQQLRKYKNIGKGKYSKERLWDKIKLLGKVVLDEAMEPTIIKTQKFLRYHYQKFLKKHNGYQILYETTEHSLQKFHTYRRLATLELDAQNHIKHLQQLLTMWEANRKLKVLPKNEIGKTLSSIYSPEIVLALFRDYFLVIQKGLFDKSRMIKKKFREVFNDPLAREPIVHNISGYIVELDVLTSLCEKYSDFLMASSSQPIGLALRFSRNRVDSKPKIFNQLQTLILDIEHSKLLCENFQLAMRDDQAMKSSLSAEIVNAASSHLREMSQPLLSKGAMRGHIEKVLKILKDIGEMTSFDPDTVKYISLMLSKIMRADWRYHVAHEIPLFHQLYHVHSGIVGPLEEHQHANRLNKFKAVLTQLEHWLKDEETVKHVQEINLCINDIKAYLQDFFASLQGLKTLAEKKDLETTSKAVEKTFEAILEYRHLFSKFFHNLRTDVPEERLIRKQFIFVDQYLEAIENRLYEINANI